VTLSLIWIAVVALAVWFAIDLLKPRPDPLE
jgi:hypothetical protein